MANFAVLTQNNVVENIIIADTKEIAEQVTNLVCLEAPSELTALAIGWTYDGTNFNPPVVETPAEETPAE